MNILITGATGFVGYYVIQALGGFQTFPQNAVSLEFLKSRQFIKHKPAPASIPISTTPTPKHKSMSAPPHTLLPHVCTPLADENGTIDLRDIKRLKSFLSPKSHTLSFDAVIHLAAQSFVPESFKNPIETYGINFTGTFNLLTALKETGFKVKMLYVSSGDIYGLVDESSLPIKEEYPLMPRNPYAVSKVAVEAMCYQWSVAEPDMRFIIARPFNHIGPNQSERFAVSSFAKQVTEIELGLRKPVISAGNIDVTRDFLDVRDVADAYKLLLENENVYDINNRFGIFNVCSGSEISMRSILNLMFEITGIDAEIRIDETKLRPNEQKRIYGSSDKLKKYTGWQPKIPLKKGIEDILNYWREKLR
jgi:GDP-4-dehydro-6-deoxy-D-mannose reductase